MPGAHDVLRSLSRLSLVGPVATTGIVVVGVCASIVLVALALRSCRRALWSTGVAAALTGGVALASWAVSRPMPPQVTGEIAMAVFIAVTGWCLAGATATGGRRAIRTTLTAVVAAVALSVTAVVAVNRDVERFPTAGSLLGHGPAPGVRFVDFAEVPGPQSRVQAGTPVEGVWRRPLRSVRDGIVTHAQIPGLRSGFAARPALVYLPPAYLDTPRPLLPVVVLVAGNPGRPDDWLGIGLAGTVSAFAAAHDGLAPVVVVPDALGADDALPLCLDSRLGNVETYLAEDVPDWVAGHLQVNTAARAWAIGGYSYGGTCAVQLAVNRPDAYPTFLDISGQDEPSVGDHDGTVAATFDGDEAAFAAVSARAELDAGARPDVSGVFVAGEDDEVYRPQQRRMYAAAAAAGLDVRYYDLPGAHSGQVWGPAFAGELGWIATRTGLLAP